jgi:hypothetical protein
MATPPALAESDSRLDLPPSCALKNKDFSKTARKQI